MNLRVIALAPCRFKRAAALFAPTPGAPGTLSEGSPRKAIKSVTAG
jgi:hypothetical protein